MEIVHSLKLDTLSKEQIEYLQKQQYEYKLLGKVQRVPGHILFSFNTKTFEVKPASIERKVSIGLDGKPIKENKVAIEADCIYLQALNQKNFIKKLRKLDIRRAKTDH